VTRDEQLRTLHLDLFGSDIRCRPAVRLCDANSWSSPEKVKARLKLHYRRGEAAAPVKAKRAGYRAAGPGAGACVDGTAEPVVAGGVARVEFRISESRRGRPEAVNVRLIGGAT
jgi:hypothetical protein